jgi:hypothetical protein
MKLTKKITLTISVLAAGLGYAQGPAESRFGQGLLGERYTELGFGWTTSGTCPTTATGGRQREPSARARPARRRRVVQL